VAPDFHFRLSGTLRRQPAPSFAVSPAPALRRVTLDHALWGSGAVRCGSWPSTGGRIVPRPAPHSPTRSYPTRRPAVSKKGKKRIAIGIGLALVALCVCGAVAGQKLLTREA